MSKQDPKLIDEMISAYLDGELSDSEREYVERLVDADPQYRRMLEELQALRDSLKSLPRFQLDEGFHQRVLERAVQHTSPSPASKESERRQVWRRLAWVGGTIAAALLLMFFLPGVFNRLDHGSMDEVGQLPDTTRATVEEQLSEQKQSGDQSVLAENALKADQPPAMRLEPTDSQPPRAKRENVRQAISAEPESLGQRGGKSPGEAVEDSAFGVAVDESGAVDALADRPFGDDPVEADGAVTNLAAVDSGLDAIVYFGKTTQTEAQAARGLYRLGAVAGSTRRGRARDFGFEGQPQLLVIEGSPEQIALSLHRIEAGNQPQAVDLALTESSEGTSEATSFGREPLNAPADRYSRADDQDRMRRSSDLYIDLEAGDTEPVVVDYVTKESAEYKKLLGFLAAKSPSASADSDEFDALPSLNGQPAESAVATELRRGTSSRQRSPAEVTGQVPVATPSTASGQTRGQTEVLFYSLTADSGRPTVQFFQEATIAGIRPDRGEMLAELKGISPKNNDGTLRVLLVLPSAEMSSGLVPQPAAEAVDAEPANEAR